MAAYSEEGSLCEAAPGSKIAGATDRKKKKNKTKKKKENRVDRQSGTG